MKPTPYTPHDVEFWKILFSLGVTSFFIFAYLYPLQPILPILAREFSVTVTVVSLAMTLSVVGLIIGLNFLGMLSDRLGRRSFVLGSLFLSVILFLSLPLFKSFIVVLILRFLQGIVIAALPASALAYMAEEIESSYLKIAVPIYISANAFGGMFGRVITGILTDLFSWQIAFFILGMMGFLFSLIVSFILPKSRFFKPTVGSFIHNIKGYLFHVKNIQLLRYFGVGLIIQVSYTAIWTYLPFHVEGPPFYYSTAFIGSLYIALIVSIPSAPLSGILANHLGTKPVLFLGLIILSFGAVVTKIENYFFLFIGLCLVSLGLFTAHSLAITLVNERATQFRGTASSLYFIAYYIGVVVGGTVLAPLWEVFGWQGITLVAILLPLLYFAYLLFFPIKR